MQWAWHFSEEAGSFVAGAGDISFDVTAGKMVSAAAGDAVRSSRPSRITMQPAFVVAIVVFSVSGLDMRFGSPEMPASGSAMVKSIFFGSLRFESSATGLCRRMWPPRACPIANSTPQMEHRCTLRLDVERSTLGRLWLVRWPPSAWNVGNWRLHVLHSNTPSAALTFFPTVEGLSPQESDSNSNSSAASLERFIKGLDALNSSFRDANCWQWSRGSAVGIYLYVQILRWLAYLPRRIHVKCRDCLRFQHAVDNKHSVGLRRSRFQMAAPAKVPAVSCLLRSETVRETAARHGSVYAVYG
ncbi:hypothetical protein BHM03_00008136 [Ensete ventricosum]|nr:hypothetical protein BHM03_00008136 [Ensete ventricosum]